jgi:hypothetical protein
MEYLAGSFITLLGMAALAAFYFKNRKDLIQGYDVIRYSQSHIHEIIKKYIPDEEFEPKSTPSQSANHKRSMYTRVVFVENQAYWIKNNTLFVADMEEGIVDEDSTREVDTMGMNKVQLDKVIYIVDALTEGEQE